MLQIWILKNFRYLRKLFMKNFLRNTIFMVFWFPANSKEHSDLFPIAQIFEIIFLHTNLNFFDILFSSNFLFYYIAISRSLQQAALHQFLSILCKREKWKKYVELFPLGVIFFRGKKKRKSSRVENFQFYSIKKNFSRNRKSVKRRKKITLEKWPKNSTYFPRFFFLRKQKK